MAGADCDAQFCIEKRRLREKVRCSVLSTRTKGEKGWSCSKGKERGRPVLGWFIVRGDEGFRKSNVLRLDRATEIENSPTTGIT